MTRFIRVFWLWFLMATVALPSTETEAAPWRRQQSGRRPDPGSNRPDPGSNRLDPGSKRRRVWPFAFPTRGQPAGGGRARVGGPGGPSRAPSEVRRAEDFGGLQRILDTLHRDAPVTTIAGPGDTSLRVAEGRVVNLELRSSVPANQTAIEIAYGSLLASGRGGTVRIHGEGVRGNIDMSPTERSLAAVLTAARVPEPARVAEAIHARTVERIGGAEPAAPAGAAAPKVVTVSRRQALFSKVAEVLRSVGPDGTVHVQDNQGVEFMVSDWRGTAQASLLLDRTRPAETQVGDVVLAYRLARHLRAPVQIVGSGSLVHMDPTPSSLRKVISNRNLLNSEARGTDSHGGLGSPGSDAMVAAAKLAMKDGVPYFSDVYTAADGGALLGTLHVVRGVTPILDVSRLGPERQRQALDHAPELALGLGIPRIRVYGDNNNRLVPSLPQIRTVDVDGPREARGELAQTSPRQTLSMTLPGGNEIVVTPQKPGVPRLVAASVEGDLRQRLDAIAATFAVLAAGANDPKLNLARQATVLGQRLIGFTQDRLELTPASLTRTLRRVGVPVAERNASSIDDLVTQIRDTHDDGAATFEVRGDRQPLGTFTVVPGLPIMYDGSGVSAETRSRVVAQVIPALQARLAGLNLRIEDRSGPGDASE